MTTALDIAGYIKSRTGLPSYDSIRLQKLVYFVQAWHLAWTGREAFGEAFEAWPNGPVVRSVFRENRYGELPSEVELEEETKSIVDAVLDHYHAMPVDTLIALTHADAPWIEARKGLGPSQPSQRQLNSKTMLDFYTAQALAGIDVPKRRVCMAVADRETVTRAGSRVIDRWREGLDLLALK